MHPYLSLGLQAFGTFTLSVVTGLMVYQTPPGTIEEFLSWMWQPSMQGIMMALGVLGINAAAKPRV